MISAGINISYSTLKTLYDGSIAVRWLQHSDGSYRAFLATPTFFCRCAVTTADDILDFETNIKGSENLVDSEEEAYVLLEALMAKLRTTAVFSILPAGRRLNRYSHDFCKKETWYQGSTKVENETLTDSGNHTTYNPATSRHWVDVTHGKLFGEVELRGTYAPVIKVDGTTKTENPAGKTSGDYSINYVTGAVTFNSALTGSEVVTATYYYPGSSLFKAQVPEDYVYRVGEVKVTLAKDVVLKDSVHFQLWGKIGGEMYPLSGAEIYQTLDDYLQDASEIDIEFPVLTGTPGDDAWRMTTVPRLHMRFSYLWSAAIDLQWSATEAVPAAEMEIRAWLANDTPFSGEKGLATFFGRKDPE